MRVYFWHFLAYVSCRISSTSGASPPLPPPGLCPGSAEKLKTPPPRSTAAGRSLHVVPPAQHHTSCNLQTTDSGKNISILMKKLREKWVEIIKNSGKMMLKILYEPCVVMPVIFCVRYNFIFDPPPKKKRSLSPQK